MTQELIRELLNDPASLEVYLETGNEGECQEDIYSTRIAAITNYLYGLLQDYLVNSIDIDEVINLINTIILKELDISKLKIILEHINNLKANVYRYLEPKTKSELFAKLKGLHDCSRLLKKLIQQEENKIAIDQVEEYILSSMSLDVVEAIIRDTKNPLGIKGYGDEDLLKRLLKTYTQMVTEQNTEKIQFLYRAILKIINSEKIRPNIIKNADSYIELLEGLDSLEAKHLRDAINSKLEYVFLEDLEKWFGVPLHYPTHIIKEYDTFVPMTNGFVDFTDHLCFTIDGPEAGCLDDAFSLVRNADGSMYFCEHIPYVPAIIPYESETNAESMRRGQTIYTSNGAYSLYPEKISYNDLSLLPNGLKYAETGMWLVDPIDYSIDESSFMLKKTIIKSSSKLTYESADAKISSRDGSAICRDLTDLGRIAFTHKSQSKITDMDSYLEKEVPIIEGDNPRYADEVFYSANIVQVFALLLGKSKAELFEKNGYPFEYRGCQLIPSLNIKSNSFKDVILSNGTETPRIGAFYSSKPVRHEPLKYRVYGHCGSPLRRSPDAFNQYLSEVFIHRATKPTDKEVYLWEERAAQAAKHYNEQNQRVKSFIEQYNFYSSRHMLVRRKNN